MTEKIEFKSYSLFKLEIARLLTNDDLKQIKFLLREFFGKGVLEKIEDGYRLMEILEERNWISAESVDNLSKLLQGIKRHDLDTQVQHYIGQTISPNLSNHDFYGLAGMHVNDNYMETLEFEKLRNQMHSDGFAILKAPPGSWKSQNAFKYAHWLSNKEPRSLKWKIHCITKMSIYNAFSHLITFLKLQCINSGHCLDDSIYNMVGAVIKRLGSETYKNSKHLFILIGSFSAELNLLYEIMRRFKACSNIMVIVTTVEALSTDWDKYVIPLKGMTKEEAVKFMRVTGDDTAEDVKNLAKKFSYLPDGLLLARTYLEIAKISIKSYLKNLRRRPLASKNEPVASTCEMLLDLIRENMSAEEKWLLNLFPYINTNSIHISILKELIHFYYLEIEEGKEISESKIAIIVDDFLVTLSNYSLISLNGKDEHRTITAHAFTFMILNSKKTPETRTSDADTLLHFFTRYLDVDCRLLEVIEKNLLLLDHAEVMLNTCEDYFQTKSVEITSMQCYVLCAVGIAYRFYGNTELSASSYFKRAKDTFYRVFLEQVHPTFDSKEESPRSMSEYLNGSCSIQKHARDIFDKLLAKGRLIPDECIEAFIKYKYRTTRESNLLCKHGGMPLRHQSNRLLDLTEYLRNNNLILPAKCTSETFLVELMIRILYNESKNLWLMNLSEEEYKHSSHLIRSNLTSSYFPVTAASLEIHQLVHNLNVLLGQYMTKFLPESSLPESVQDNVGLSECKISRFRPMFGPVTIRNGILYMLRSITSDHLQKLLNESIELLDQIDADIEGVGFTEFGVVKRIGNSSLFHTVMIERLKMECYEKLSNIHIVPKDTESTELEQNRDMALGIAHSLEEHINEMQDWKAQSQIRLKIAKVYFRLSRDEEGFRKATEQIKKAYHGEYELNSVRLTRFHLKAIVHYGECCLKDPTEEELLTAKHLLSEVKSRFQQGEANKLIDDVLKDLESALEKTHMVHTDQAERRNSNKNLPVQCQEDRETDFENGSHREQSIAVCQNKLEKLKQLEKEKEEELRQIKDELNKLKEKITSKTLVTEF